MALSGRHAAAVRPMSVEEIVKQAEDFEFNNNRSLKNWLRSGQMLLTEASMCEHDGDLQIAYLYLYRHAQLVLAQMPKHPEYKDPNRKAEIAQAQKNVQKNLTKLEQWKPRINQQYQRYVNAMERRNAEMNRIEQHEHEIPTGSSHSFDGGHYDESESAEHLDANEHRELAVDIAQRELHRRSTMRRAFESLSTRSRSPSADHHGLGRVGDEIRHAGERLMHGRQHNSKPADSSQRYPSTSSFQYPSVPPKGAVPEWKAPTPPNQPPSYDSSLPPLPPAKEILTGQSSPYQTQTQPPPPLPAKTEHDRSISPSPSPAPTRPPIRSKYTFKTNASTESGIPLRTVMLPPDLRTSFLNLADANTQCNLETCGILCGTLIANALFISHLILPDQTSTSDTCDTTESGDNALFDYCDTKGLLVCGWIHTHPSQTCFLSSRDLHTSSGYQVMLPEAVAIVCAPRHNPDWGIFRLTDPPGLPAILNCRQSGLFHPHSESKLYTDALRPGHVVEAPGLKFEVVDLRKR